MDLRTQRGALPAEMWDREGRNEFEQKMWSSREDHLLSGAPWGFFIEMERVRLSVELQGVSHGASSGLAASERISGDHHRATKSG